MRDLINAILYFLRTGCQWHNLPREFPTQRTAYH
jgi:putative transposase